MNGFTVHELAANPTVRVARDMAALPPALERHIDALWDAASRRVEAGGAGRLFNGRVFSVDAIGPTEILGHFTEYRRLVAQMEEHALFADLGIRSLAVCGVLRCADGIAIGRRPAAAIYQPGLWQLPPAGSVDASALRPGGTIDLRGQLMTELREELGLGHADVGEPTVLCVVEHPGSHVCDLGMALTTRLSGELVRSIHRARGNAEYDPLAIVAVDAMPGFLARAGSSVAPPTFEFLRRTGVRTA